jgi:selenocysteine lyase/cysteine desulfurase
MNTTFSDQEIKELRDETPGCTEVNHLNNAGAALMPKPILDAIQQHIELEGRVGGYEAADIKKEVIKELYTVTAKMLNCKPHNIAYTANATDSYTRAISAIPFERGDIILTTNDDFISNQIQFLSLVKRFGVIVKHAKNAPGGGVDLEDLDAQLYQWKPKLLAITHIPTNSGLVQPVEEIGKIVSKHDTIYILDACQSAGQIPLDVEKLNCDFLSVTCRKFLRGARGTGFLYISDKVLDKGLEPLFIDMRGADWVAKDQYVPRDGAIRFEDWEFAYALLLGTKAAIEYYLAVGPERIWNRVQLLADYTRKQLDKIPNLRLLDKGPQLCSLITFTIPGLNAEQIKAELFKRKINVVTSYRNFAVIDFDEKGVEWAIRVSPHYYNIESEIDLFVFELIQVIQLLSSRTTTDNKLQTVN